MLAFCGDDPGGVTGEDAVVVEMNTVGETRREIILITYSDFLEWFLGVRENGHSSGTLARIMAMLTADDVLFLTGSDYLGGTRHLKQILSSYSGNGHICTADDIFEVCRVFARLGSEVIGDSVDYERARQRVRVAIQEAIGGAVVFRVLIY